MTPRPTTVRLRCMICRSTDLSVERNGDGLYVATCHGCGATSQPAATVDEVERQLRRVAASELAAGQEAGA